MALVAVLVLLMAASSSSATTVQTAPALPITSGMYYVDSCQENAPCCLDGFVAVAADGYLTFNLAGFSPFCGRDLRLGFDERVGNLKPQLGEEGANTFTELVELPHAESGTQYLEFSIKANSTLMTIRNVGARRVIASGTASWVVSLDQGLRDGLSRDPGMRYVDIPPGTGDGELSFAAAAFVAVLCTCLAYVVAGFVYTKRGGPEAKWDGPWEHVHAQQWREVYDFTSAKLAQAKDAVQQRMDKSRVSNSHSTSSSSSDFDSALPPMPQLIASTKPPTRRSDYQSAPVSPTRSGSSGNNGGGGGDFGTPSKARRPSRAGAWFGGAVRAPLFFAAAPVGPEETGSSSSHLVASSAVLSSPAPVNNRRNSLQYQQQQQRPDDHRAEWV